MNSGLPRSSPEPAEIPTVGAHQHQPFSPRNRFHCSSNGRRMDFPPSSPPQRAHFPALSIDFTSPVADCRKNSVILL